MKTFFLSLLILIFIYSCTKTITPHLNTVSSQLIIQGAISDTAGPYYVSIVNSVDFYASNNYPGVSGASVIITNVTTGVRDSLTEASTGLYMTHAILQGVPGNTYLLNVSLNGNTYKASSTMPRHVNLDSVTFDFTDTTRIEARANYQDPSGIHNFYKYGMVINGVVDKRFLTFDDRLSDGRYIRDNVDADTSEIKRYNAVQVNLVGVDSNVYTFLHEAENVAYNNGSLVGPANPVSNISGGCLGYFSAQTVSNKTATAKP